MSNSLWQTNGQCNFTDGNGNEPTAANWRETLQNGCFPIGSIIPWMKSFTNVPSIPKGWKECDGSTISDSESPLNGQAMPNINGSAETSKKFLRGATTSGGEGSTATHTHGNAEPGNWEQDGSGDPWDDQSHVPKYFEAVFIMRYK